MSDPGVELELAGMLVGLGETGDDPALRRRTGTVTAKSGASYSVSIGGTVITGVRSLVPLAVGDVAEIVFDGPRPLAVAHVDTGWHTVTLLSTWTGTIRRRKVGGIVYLNGYINLGVGTTNPAFNLPAAWRPANSAQRYPVMANNGGTSVVADVIVDTNGDVSILGAGTTYTTLDAVRFVAEQ